MSRTPSDRRPVLLSFRFLGPALVGSLAMGLVSAFAPPPAQVAALGILVSILGGLFVSYLDQEDERERRRAESLERLAVPLALAAEPDLYPQYLAFCRTLTALAGRTDPILREVAALKLASVNAQLGTLADGAVVFAGTETWRAVYDRLLAAPDLREYRSVAWVRSADYWRDPPGRQSMRATFDAAHRGVLVDRIVVLRDDLWPRGRPLPTADVLPWLEEQLGHGVRVSLVREADLAAEPDLLADVGVYGDRACGVQELDERSRTVRFVLSFDPPAVRLAADRFRRLAVYATPLPRLLDTDDEAP
jgi:hypothetical protein